uniref:sensor domain-containing protein n=1 Tax=Fodinicola feengrottensis TaxID=435914 RepID=UPI0036F40F51
MALMGFSVAGSPHREPPAPGARTWLRARLTESATWRELFFLRCRQVPCSGFSI